MKSICRRILLILITAVIISACSLTSFAAKPYNVTIKNDQIFLDGKQLTNSSSKKSLPMISPDRRKILYVCILSNGRLQLGTVDTKTKSEKIIKIDQDYLQITGIEWLNSQRFGLSIHINPSLETYQIYDVKSCKNLGKYYGYGFTFNESKSHLVYVQAPPHFSSQLGEYAVMLDESILFKTNENTAVDNTLYPSTDFKRVAFYQYNLKNESKSDIVILLLEKNKVKSKKIIPWNRQRCELKWKSQNMLIIGNTAEYDILKSKLISRK